MTPRAEESKRETTTTPPVEGVDFYLEGPFVVFTEGFLRQRGYCCESGCRHCPYNFRKEARADVATRDS
jgi:hypothetical protein